ncbi:uncharacterized protein LOC120634371 isoform X2 [Pararge aegeria]|uniref:uncharacterized protein LOC120634371 isoform X2 n=1 Tax=Pararge aegeria TaxID=116150 RepID=UPI0019D1DEB3|nr:uncharacterized protein LOC120634371 isoform X2 [Pararge aegeria]
MAYYFEEPGDYAVTPMLISPCGPEKYCEAPPICYSCLPHCPKGQMVYYCDKPQCTKSPRRRDDPCNDIPEKPNSHYKRQLSPPTKEDCCPTCNNPCKPIKTKYVIPCYRYEDGRIEQYVPTRHGRLPMSAYRRNGIQDQIYGYRGAVRHLCAGGVGSKCYVYTAVEPILRLFPRVTQEVLPIKRKKIKSELKVKDYTKYS